MKRYFWNEFSILTYPLHEGTSLSVVLVTSSFTFVNNIVQGVPKFILWSWNYIWPCNVQRKSPNLKGELDNAGR